VVQNVAHDISMKVSLIDAKGYVVREAIHLDQSNFEVQLRGLSTNNYFLQVRTQKSLHVQNVIVK
jgi:hypothetical protein